MENERNKISKKVRGKFLTTLLILNGLVSLYDLISFIQIGSWHNNPLRVVTFPVWYDFVYLAILTLSIVCLIFIFLWKKWAVYVSFSKAILFFLFELLWRSWNTNYKGH